MSTAIEKMRDMMGEVRERWALYDDCGHADDRERAEEFERRMALYAQVAQAEAAERQAAALERIAALMETQEADRQADLRSEEMRAEWAARVANPGY